LSQLRETNCQVRLLLQHPDSAPSDFQQRRIRQNLANLLSVTFHEYGRFEIRLYRVAASVRGRCFDDDLVTVGWYRRTADRTRITGHTNPMFVAFGHSDEGRELITWFRQAFGDLWNHPGTVRVDDESLDGNGAHAPDQS
jgi:hypothetical protein